MNDIYTRIEDYLDKALTDAERAVFEAELRKDPALTEALKQVREARERLARQWAEEDAESALRNTLNDIGKQHFSDGKTALRSQLTPIRIRWWIAAAVAASALIVWLSWPSGAVDLYERYRKFPEASFVLKSDQPATQTLEAAAKLFNDKRFDAALPLLNAHSKQYPGDLEARFFAGLCQIELGQLAEAEVVFKQLGSTENAWSGEARWYLALTYLKQEKWAACKEVLQQIPPGVAHYAEALVLAERLPKIGR